MHDAVATVRSFAEREVEKSAARRQKRPQGTEHSTPGDWGFKKTGQI